MAPDSRGDVAGRQAPMVRAAEYVRMSTEHQQYSTENQRDKSKRSTIDVYPTAL